MNIHEVMENIETIIPAPPGMEINDFQNDCFRPVICLALISDTEKHIEPMIVDFSGAGIFPVSIMFKDSREYSIKFRTPMVDVVQNSSCQWNVTAEDKLPW